MADKRLIIDIVSSQNYSNLKANDEVKTQNAYKKRAKGDSAWKALQNIESSDGTRIFSESDIQKISVFISNIQANGALDVTDAIKKAGLDFKLKEIDKTYQNTQSAMFDMTSNSQDNPILFDMSVVNSTSNTENLLKYNDNKLNNLFISAFKVIPDNILIDLKINGEIINGNKYEILDLLAKDGIIQAEDQSEFILKAREIALEYADIDKNALPENGKNSTKDIEIYKKMADSSLYFGASKKHKNGKLRLENKIENGQKSAIAVARRMLRLVDETKLAKIKAFGYEDIILSENATQTQKIQIFDYDLIPQIKKLNISEELKATKLFKIFVASILTTAYEKHKNIDYWVKNNTLTPEIMADAVNTIRNKNIELRGNHKNKDIKTKDKDRYLGVEKNVKNAQLDKFAFDLLNSVDNEFDFYNWYGKNNKEQYLTRKKQISSNKRNAQKASRVMLRDLNETMVKFLLEEAKNAISKSKDVSVIKTVTIKKEKTEETAPVVTRKVSTVPIREDGGVYSQDGQIAAIGDSDIVNKNLIKINNNQKGMNNGNPINSIVNGVSAVSSSSDASSFSSKSEATASNKQGNGTANNKGEKIQTETASSDKNSSVTNDVSNDNANNQNRQNVEYKDDTQIDTLELEKLKQEYEDSKRVNTNQFRTKTQSKPQIQPIVYNQENVQNQINEQLKQQFKDLQPQLDVEMPRVEEITNLDIEQEEYTNENEDLIQGIGETFDELAAQQKEYDKMTKELETQRLQAEPPSPLRTPPKSSPKPVANIPTMKQPPIEPLIPSLPQLDVEMPRVEEITNLDIEQEEYTNENEDLIQGIDKSFDKLVENYEPSNALIAKEGQAPQPLNSQQDSISLVTSSLVDGAYNLYKYSKPTSIKDIELDIAIPNIEGLNLDSQKVVNVSNQNGRTLTLENGDTLNLNGDTATFETKNGNQTCQYIYSKQPDGTYQFDSISERQNNSPTIVQRDGHFAPVHCTSLLGKNNTSYKEAVHKGLTMMPHYMSKVDKVAFDTKLAEYLPNLQAQFTKITDSQKIVSYELNYDGSYSATFENGNKFYIYKSPKTGKIMMTKVEDGKITQQFKMNNSAEYSLDEYTYGKEGNITKNYTKNNKTQYYSLRNDGWSRVDAPAAVSTPRISDALSNGKSIDAVYRTQYPMSKEALDEAMTKFTIKESLIPWGENSIDVFNKTFETYKAKGTIHSLEPVSAVVLASALAKYPEKSEEFEFAIYCIDSKEKLDHVNQILSKGLAIKGNIINRNALASKVLNSKSSIITKHLARYDKYFEYLYDFRYKTT